MSGYFPDDNGWSPEDEVVDVHVEIPPMPELSKPRVWPWVLVALGLFVQSQLLYMASHRLLVFVGGASWAFAILVWLVTCHQRRMYRAAVKNVESGYREMKLRAAMFPPLTMRYGPERTFEIMRLGEELVEEGDFPDIRAAVAQIERHLDNEPLTYDDE